MAQPDPADDGAGRQASDFDALVAEHERAVWRYAARLVPQADADDITAMTFERAWRDYGKLRAGHGSIQGWLFRVAHNLCMDHYRSARRRAESSFEEAALEIPDDGADPAKAVSDSVAEDVQEKLKECYAALEEAYRLVYDAAVLLEMTNVEVAAMLGMTPSNVGTVKQRAGQKLRTCLGSKGVTKSVLFESEDS